MENVSSVSGISGIFLMMFMSTSIIQDIKNISVVREHKLRCTQFLSDSTFECLATKSRTYFKSSNYTPGRGPGAEPQKLPGFCHIKGPFKNQHAETPFFFSGFLFELS